MPAFRVGDRQQLRCVGEPPQSGRRSNVIDSRAAPDKRFDAMGICMLLDRCDVVGVDADGADLIARTGDACTRYYRRPVPLETISFGELAVAAGEPIPADYQDDIDA